MTEFLQKCVACGADQTYDGELSEQFQLARCAMCGLVFTRNPDTAVEQYTAIYEKRASKNVTPTTVEYTYATPLARLALENIAFVTPIPRLIPAERKALDWIKKNIKPGSLILDCGCGTGRFLAAARQAGFRTVGLEVSSELTEALQKRGYEVVLGEAPSFPWNKEDPTVITFFEVLEHIPEPAKIVEPLVSRFPQTHILASVPSPKRVPVFLKNKREPTDFPPHHYLRWTAEALQHFFKRMKFSNVAVLQPDPDGYELIDIAPVLYKFSVMQKLLPRKKVSSRPITASTSNSTKASVSRRLSATLILILHRFSQHLLSWLGYPLAKQAARRGASAGSMLVIAQHS